MANLSPLNNLGRITATSRRFSALVEQMIDGELNVSPSYQRGSEWTYEQCQNLVKSILMGIPIPAIVINNRHAAGWIGWKKDFTDAVIDGKQRIEAMSFWFEGELEVPADWFSEEFILESQRVPVRKAGFLTYTSSLTPQGQRLFKSQALVPVAEAMVSSEAEEAKIYVLLNSSSTPQSDEAMQNARAVAAS